MTLHTGAASLRGLRPSQLLFHWRSRYASLEAETGQVGAFETVAVGSILQNIGRNDASITGGRAPRWYQASAFGSVTRLLLEQVGGNDVERIRWTWPLRVMALSVYLKLWPYFWAPGSNTGINPWALQIGDATGGGSLVIGRPGVGWQANRTKGGTSIQAGFIESSSNVYPIDVLVTLSAAGVLSLTTRDAVGVMQTNSSAADSSLVNTADLWGGSVMYFGAGDLGGHWLYEIVKVARGVQTFTSIDAMS